MLQEPSVPTAIAAPVSAAYSELRALLREAGTLASIGSLLGWDQETYMPPAASAHRGNQAALIARTVHEKITSKRMGDLIAACEADPSLRDDPEASANLREVRRDYDLATKLPTDLVAEIARVGSLSQEAWKGARARSEYALFVPLLTELVGLIRRKAQCLGSPKGGNGAPGELYDALLDEFEPGMTAARVEAIFTPLRSRLSPFIAEIARSKYVPDRTVLELEVPPARQDEFARVVLKAMHFDLRAGRLDLTTHPFCSGIAPGDTRLTFRYSKEGFLEPLYGVMHEAGHGLYEQGLPKAEHFGEPLGQSISLGIHESQSRMWENFVGRSRAFWEWAFPHAREVFGPVMDQFDADSMYRAANIVSPSFIRVEADETTYNLHIMLRFQIERAIISGQLAIKDIPGEWNRLFEEYMGLKVPDDRHGCLQDVHWSFGAFGYFPTYTLGNLYAGQLWETINSQITGLDSQFARGEFGTLKAWLNENIHQHGKRFRAEELCRRITGKPLSADGLLRYLEGKIRKIYGI
jgi:carboxypeptidase Taq